MLGKFYNCAGTPLLQIQECTEEIQMESVESEPNIDMFTRIFLEHFRKLYGEGGWQQ